MMRRFLSAILSVFMLLLGYALPVMAAQTIDLYIDDNKVATERYMYLGVAGDIEGKYYMDISPQIKNERTYVPLSIIIKILGADISWQKPTVTITFNTDTLILTIGETEVIQNGKRIQLDAVPYVSDGRTMVPLRFISEAFGLTVNYKDNRVDINFPEKKVNNTTVSSIQAQYWMTMGSVISESKNNICISRIYDVLDRAKTKEISEPSLFGNYHNLDVLEFYPLSREYCFTDNTNNIVEQYEIYYELSFGMSTGVYILRDVTNSKWYSFTQEAYYDILDLEKLGDWPIISNTVV